MIKVFFVSKNESFKNDLCGQIKYYAKEFQLCNSIEESPDVVVIDGEIPTVENLAGQMKIPVVKFVEKENDKGIKGGQILVKPFDLLKFFDVLKSINNLFENSQEGCLEFGCFVLNPQQKEIINKNSQKAYKLTEKEVAIIKYLYKNSGKYVGKQDLLSEVWGYADDTTTHTVETHIYRLRQKVEDDDSEIIETSEGGYSLKLPK